MAKNICVNLCNLWLKIKTQHTYISSQVSQIITSWTMQIICFLKFEFFNDNLSCLKFKIPNFVY